MDILDEKGNRCNAHYLRWYDENVNNKRCEIDGCKTQASFGNKGENALALQSAPSGWHDRCHKINGVIWRAVSLHPSYGYSG